MHFYTSYKKGQNVFLPQTREREALLCVVAIYLIKVQRSNTKSS